MPIKRLKQYILPIGNELIAHHSAELDKAALIGKGLTVDVDFVEHIQAGDFSPVVDRIVVSQHKNEWIQNIIFGIHINVVNVPPQEQLTFNNDILSNKKILQWLARMGGNPMIFFFLKNHEIGSASIFAHILLKNNIETKNNFEMGEKHYRFETKQIQEIFNKLFNGCVFFNEYCYATNIYTKNYIEEAIKNFRERFGFGNEITTFNYTDIIESWNQTFEPNQFKK